MPIVKRRIPSKSTGVFKVPASTPAGTPLRIGSHNIVTLTDEAKGGNAALHATGARDGSFVLSVPGAGTASDGDAVYITPGNALSLTASGNTPFGTLLGDKAAGTQDVEVLIAG